MIKISLRPNLKYLVQLIVYSFLRNISEIIMGRLLNFKIDLIYLPLMFLGEFLFGLIFYLCQKKYLHKISRDEKTKLSSIELIYDEITYNEDSEQGLKLLIMIFFISFFDFIEFVLSVGEIPKFFLISNTIVSRFAGIFILTQAIFYRYQLKIQIYKHQKLSLIIVSTCLIITIITEFIFQDINIFFGYYEFVFCIIIIIIIQIFNSFIDLIEKYLFQFHNLNPYKCLFLEGAFGLIFSFIYMIYENPLPDLTKYYNNNSDIFIYLMLLLIVFVILSGLKNAYRVITIKIYSPIASALAEYFLNPIYVIISFSLFGDFISNGSRNFVFFLINLILSIFISFSGCIYNELLILFCCKLEHNTYHQISFRAELHQSGILYEEDDEDDL